MTFVAIGAFRVSTQVLNSEHTNSGQTCLNLDMKNIFLDFNQMHAYSYLKQILNAQFKLH